MKWLSLALFFLLPTTAANAVELAVSQPLDYQVIQRSSRDRGEVHVVGKLTGAEPAGMTAEYRLVDEKGVGDWKPLASRLDGASMDARFAAPAGGWYRLELRAMREGAAIAQSSIDHVGIGEIFVVTGQSNSANHGAQKQSTQTRRVATFNGKKWQPSNDPQPGASGNAGSMMPPLGDALVKRLNVPVGFVACGIGATSVREWLPKGTTFPNPPTIVSRVEKLASGEWASKGDAYAMLVARMKQMGPNGFRAVLWHQGESDANQKDTTRTLPGKLYRQYMEQLIKDSRKDIGWEAPWMVAQVSYHGPADEGSPDIRDAQASLWKDKIALEGPDSDALKGDYRDSGGKGVHFSGKGLQEHGAKWAEKVAPWVERQLSGDK